MLLKITHQTRFEYSASVDHAVLAVRMAPSSDEDQTVLSFDLQVTPPASLVSYRDGYGNRVDLFNLAAAHRELRLDASSLVRTHRRKAASRLGQTAWNREWSSRLEAVEYGASSPLVDHGPLLERLLDDLPRPGNQPLAGFLMELMTTIRKRLTYDNRATTERTVLSEALALGRGVCQDFAHLCIGACRMMGIPARYVSGYVNHPGEIATHAWCQVWCGSEIEWIDLDPTTARFADDDHVVVAIGRDYSDVPPNRGVWKGDGEERMEVTVRVEPLERLPSSWENRDVEQAWRRNGPGVAVPVRGESRRGVEQRNWPAYPDQAQPQALLYRQQGQQQQQ